MRLNSGNSGLAPPWSTTNVARRQFFALCRHYRHIWMVSLLLPVITFVQVAVEIPLPPHPTRREKKRKYEKNMVNFDFFFSFITLLHCCVSFLMGSRVSVTLWAKPPRPHATTVFCFFMSDRRRSIFFICIFISGLWCVLFALSGVYSSAKSAWLVRRLDAPRTCPVVVVALREFVEQSVVQCMYVPSSYYIDAAG